MQAARSRRFARARATVLFPAPGDADDQDDHGLLGYVFVLVDHESILTREPSRKTRRPTPPHLNAPSGTAVRVLRHGEIGD